MIPLFFDTINESHLRAQHRMVEIHKEARKEQHQDSKYQPTIKKDKLTYTYLMLEN